MVKFFGKYWLVIVIAFLIGVIHYFPQILFENKLGDNYHGFHFLISTDEYVKLAKVQDVYDGHYFSGNPVAAEYKNEPYSDGINIVEMTTAFIGRALGLNAYQVNLLMKFVLPVILFFLLYYLTLIISRSKYGSLITPTLVLLGSQLKAPQFIPGIIRDIINFNYSGLLIYLRPSHPSFSFIFLLIGLIFLFWFFKTKKLSYGLGAGVTLGLLFYIYAFFWTFFLVVFGVVLLYLIIKKDWQFFGKVLLVLILGLLIGSFYLYVYLTIDSPNAILGGITVRQTFFMTHKFIFDKTVLAVTVLYALFLAYLWKVKELRSRYLFPLFLLISAIIIANQQVITGRLIQYQHWYWYTNLPAAFLAGSVVLIYILEELRPRLKKALIWLILALLLLFGFGSQYSYYQYYLKDRIYQQNYGRVFEWLNKNTEKDSVVYSDKEISEYIPAFTHNNVYWSVPLQFQGTTPIERVLHNYYAYVRISANPDEDAIMDYLKAHKEEISYLILSFQVIEEQCGGIRTCYSNKVLDELAKGYKKFLKLPIEEQLKKYKIDYMVWDYNKNKTVYLDLEKYPKLFEYNNIVVYDFKAN